MNSHRCYGAYYKTIIFIVSVFSLFSLSCGKNITAPDGSTITINPTTITFKNITSDTIADFVVTVRYPDGEPMPYAKVRISGAFAVPNAVSAYQFYYKAGGTQTVGNPAVDSPFEAQTDEFGTYHFSVVLFGNLVFNDTIYVTSGSASGTTKLESTQD